MRAKPSNNLFSLLLNPLPWLANRLPQLGSQVQATLSQSSLGSIGSFFSYARGPVSLSVTDPQGNSLFASEVPSLLSTAYNGGHLLWVGIMFATFLGVGWVTATCTLRRLFFVKVLTQQREASQLDLASLLDPNKTWNEPQLLLLLHPTTEQRIQLTIAQNAVNFAQLSPAGLQVQKDGQVWLLPDLEAHLDDPDMIERIAQAAAHAKRLVLLSEVEPLRRSKPERLDAWTDALQGFREEEGGVLALSSLQRPSTALMAAWWRDCDDDERRVLWQLSVEGYTNPHPANVPAIKHLVGRGLLRADKLTIASPAFADYVSHTSSPDDARRWQDAGEATVWQSIRVPLSTAVAALLTALAASKPELGIASALVPLATVSLPSLIRIVTATLSKAGG